MTQAKPLTCEHCGAPLDGKTPFCGSCGKAVGVPVGQNAAAHKHTVFGMPQVMPVQRSLDPAPVAAVPAESATDDNPADRERNTEAGVVVPPRGQMGRTMLGVMPMVQPQSPPPSAEPSRGESQRPGKAGAIRTKFGLGELESPRPPAGPGGTQPAVIPPSAGVPARTMIGTAEALQAGVGDAERPVAGAARGVPMDQTLLGLEQAQAGDGSASSAADGGEPGADSDRARAPKLATQAGAEWARDSVGRDSMSRDSLFSTAPAPRRGLSLVALVLFGLLLITAVVLGVLALSERAPDVRVHVVSEAGRDSLEFEVPGAQPGAKIRFGGQEQPLVAGRARFALAADAIRVGENVVLFDLVSPDGSVDAGRIGLAVDYRATIDTGPLRAGKAAVDVVVSARPGSRIWLDGQPVMLDAQGRAVRSDPIELGSGQGSIEHVVRYRVEPPGGEAVVGELRTTLTLTSLTIDAPGPELTTDRDSVEISGEVEPNATVTIDNRKVAVSAGRFLEHYPLPNVGDFRPTITAMAEGKSPRAVTISLHRVADLAKAAVGFKADPTLTYAKIVQNPNMYRGQKVAMEGRVYNASIDAGHSALQVLVRQCPKGQRCPLWVSYPAATTQFEVDSWVRVLGTLDGEQQFRPVETNQVSTVPKVVAEFLLPMKP